MPFQRTNNFDYLQAAYSSHYAQAYIQSLQSSHRQPFGDALGHTTSPPSSNAGPSRPSSHFNNHAPSWYHPGPCRCSYKDCTFAGSQKSLEIHRMDRHLIYPHGWDKHSKKSDWDADPSLKGKPVPIQGTNIFLDTPAQLEAWIAERKRRWPSKHRVEDKNRKMDEAIARGQLTMQELGLPGTKRRRTDEQRLHDFRANRRTNRGRGGYRSGSNRVPLAKTSSGPPHEVRTTIPGLASALPACGSSSGDSDDDGAPEVVSSKIRLPADNPTEEFEAMQDVHASNSRSERHPIANQKLPANQPRKQPYNPFGNHSALLRNLLLPEIRITVSNLSQAIRFLVDNDFLEDVELKPGDAEDRKIEVLS